jgi:hypothetical protein
MNTVHDDYLKTDYNEGVTKSNPTQKCRPAKDISNRVNIQIKNGYRYNRTARQ